MGWTSSVDSAGGYSFLGNAIVLLDSDSGLWASRTWT